MITRTMSLESPQEAQTILGSLNENARLVDAAFSTCTEITVDGLTVRGELQGTEQALAIYQQLKDASTRAEEVDEQRLKYMISLATAEDSGGFQPDFVSVTAKGRPIYSKTKGQKKYLEAIAKHDVSFAVGPAGTGKTYLAVAMAVKALRAQEVSRIILTRPAVEAGEKLGFLPGDLQSKLDPYMRPLHDALRDFLGPEQYFKLQERGTIEISPLAYMRGRTLDDAFIILDEAQNTSPEQMKMFLTRMGFHSKVVVTGDITQIDLPRDKRSGLLEAQKVLANVEGIAFVRLTSRDVVRNQMVQQIILAYEKFEGRRRR
ncbi:MAG: PhoH family protein [Eubacteriales bacterium]|nr:PhoH family protein [Eubacteriales bacterium]